MYIPQQGSSESKHKAIILARCFGLKTLPENVDFVRIQNEGRDALDEVVSREEFEAQDAVPANVTLTYECFRVTVERSRRPSYSDAYFATLAYP